MGHEIQRHPPCGVCDKQHSRQGKAWIIICSFRNPKGNLSCAGPLGRHATVLSIAGCVGSVRLTSQAGGPLMLRLLDTPPRYDNKQQWKVVLQESSDRWRGLTCLPTILIKKMTCTMQGLNSFRCPTPTALPRTNLCQPWFWEARRCRIFRRSSLMLRRTMLITCALRHIRNQSLSALM